MKFAAAAVALVFALLPAMPAAALTQSQAIGKKEVYEAQTIMHKFGIPYGPYDGLNGPNTSQGLCIFRTATGMTPSRANLDAPTLAKLREYNANYENFHVPAPTKNGKNTYVHVSQTCQSLMYVHNGKYMVTFQASTGGAGKETPNGTYAIGDTVKGWTCSTIYRDTCSTQTAGQYATYKDAQGKTRNYGNMYNKRAFKNGGFYIHGSNNVPTTPGSGGCIRVTVPNADWISQNIATGTTLFVDGRYNSNE
ncbi:MAG TPA: L,D-transpeptidase, partial [Candidatus Saccharimonadales bacterium]|nr:L,D-transpeptidase [Candidatus Saccharimonadales bacterium]